MPTRESVAEYKQAKARYEAQLVEYQAKLATYRDALERWNDLPSEERAALDKEAEKESRVLWSLVLALGVCVWLYRHWRPLYSGDSFWRKLPPLVDHS